MGGKSMEQTAAKDATTKFVVIGLLLGILMSAMDNTIVATAMGNIVADLGSFDKFAWVTASYMVAVMARYADLRKTVRYVRT